MLEHRNNNHVNGLPFLVLHETKHSISFLSIDIPATEEGHVLVIPKKHYSDLELIPKYIQYDLMEHISLISKALRVKNHACNILLNNGKEAGQCIYHTHFHIIPRNQDDNIAIEVWKSREINKETYQKLHEEIKLLVESVKLI
jgi:diadenosine tetraphosphate (Ap4A) HIT family hydrolase